MTNTTTVDTKDEQQIVNAPEATDTNAQPLQQDKDTDKLKQKKDRIVPILEAICTTLQLPSELLSKPQAGPVFHIIGNTVRCSRTRHKTPLIHIDMTSKEVISDMTDTIREKINFFEDKFVEDDIRLNELERKLQRLQQKMSTMAAEQEQLNEV